MFPSPKHWSSMRLDAIFPLFNPNQDLKDHHKWSLNANSEFSISSLSNELRTQYPKVAWNKSIWFSSHIPKCIMIAWLAIHNRLSTGDRLVLFGAILVSCWVFCPWVETRDHIFFNCAFTSQIWSQILTHIYITWTSRSWANWIKHISDVKGKTFKSLIIKLVFTAKVYQIWLERNVRKFQNATCTIPTIVNKIRSLVTYRLLSLENLP